MRVGGGARGFHHFCPPRKVFLTTPGKIDYWPPRKKLLTPRFPNLCFLRIPDGFVLMNAAAHCFGFVTKQLGKTLATRLEASTFAQEYDFSIKLFQLSTL